MNKIVKQIRKTAKIIIDYNIVGDYKVYRLKYTPIKVKFLMTRKYNKLWKNKEINTSKVIFDNYMGSGFGCNGKYVTLKLLKTNPKLDIVWVVKNAAYRKNEFPKGVRLVEYMSDEAFYEYATAAVWVCNFQMVAYINKGLRKKEGQSYIQMWHGSFGIKKIENDCNILKADKNWIILSKMNAQMTDYWISNSVFENEVYTKSFWNVKDILMYGHPRNDIFFNENSKLTIDIRSKLGIREGVKNILYVPTFRDNADIEGFTLDYGKLVQSLRERFGGEWNILIRMHPKMKGMANKVIPKEDYIVDVTAYPDIQELLLMADALVTDYSSAIFDFMLTKKPGFIYATDIDGYDKQRGLYYPMEQTPFPIARNNDELRDNVINFNEESYKQRVSQFLADKGSVEDGNATDKVVSLIDSLVSQK